MVAEYGNEWVKEFMRQNKETLPRSREVTRPRFLYGGETTIFGRHEAEISSFVVCALCWIRTGLFTVRLVYTVGQKFNLYVVNWPSMQQYIDILQWSECTQIPRAERFTILQVKLYQECGSDKKMYSVLEDWKCRSSWFTLKSYTGTVWFTKRRSEPKAQEDKTYVYRKM